jgi:bifunctional ADP-heptose synthase (sugar kinase/adenylyltransferase)
VSAEAAPRGCTLVTGYFDALLAGHARGLSALPHPLLVAVLPLSGELMSQRARAEMVAGLRVVDYVVIADTADPDALCERLQPAQIVRMEAADELRTHQLREHVRNRQTR